MTSGPGSRPGPPLWHQSLGFRLAAVLTVTLVAFDLLRRPLYELALRSMGLEGVHRALYGGVGVVLSLLVATGLAALIARAISNRWMGRFNRLVQTASAPTEGDDLPGPFDDSGNDEIAMLASAMNSIRDKVLERHKEFSLQDIRRREWIAEVSHDLRTPLTAQLACLDRADAIVQKLDSQPRRKELHELLTVAKLDADRVRILADDLLEIARLDAGDSLTLEHVPPGELVRQAVLALGPLASQKGIEVEVKVASHLPVLNADGRLLTRAVENLLRNAIQHASTRVEVIAVLAEPSIRFEVRDDGRGVPTGPDFLDYLRRLSSRYRLTELARRRGQGDSAGLGLVVAQRVAEAHDGVVGAYNLSRGGAAFWMDVPYPEEGSLLSDGTKATDVLSGRLRRERNARAEGS